MAPAPHVLAGTALADEETVPYRFGDFLKVTVSFPARHSVCLHFDELCHLKDHGSLFPSILEGGTEMGDVRPGEMS